MTDIVSRRVCLSVCSLFKILLLSSVLVGIK